MSRSQSRDGRGEVAAGRSRAGTTGGVGGGLDQLRAFTDGGERLERDRRRQSGDRRGGELSWPGAGDQPHDPLVPGYEGCVEIAVSQLSEQSDLVAQSMGGVLAITLALRCPERVRRIVLVATSGGIDVAGLGGADWREEYRAEFPRAAPWVWRECVDHSDRIRTVSAPTCLIWGDADPISPVSVGQRLAEILPRGTLHVLPGGTHSVAHDRPNETAALIIDHLQPQSTA